jgi:hypothetical protein
VKELYAAERPAVQLPPRRALQDAFKKATISRAEGGQLQAPVRRRSLYGLHEETIVRFLDQLV